MAKVYETLRTKKKKKEETQWNYFDFKNRGKNHLNVFCAIKLRSLHEEMKRGVMK